MKCPNCNADIKEGSIICPICNTQFAFNANDNYINLPNDDFVINSGGVEEYVDPHENDTNKPVDATPGVLNLKSNPAPKKVIKRVVKVNTQTPQEESVEISPTVNVDMNDEIVDNTPKDLETTVVEVGGFTNTIIDASSTQEIPVAQEVKPQAPTPSDLQAVVPLNQTVNNVQGVGNDLISNVDIQTNTIGQVSQIETQEEKKPRKKMSETMMIALIMGLILILLCFIIYILLENNKNKAGNETTTTQMTTFNCNDNNCSTTTTTVQTTVETTTKEILKNKGLKSTVEIPLTIGQTSVCDIYDKNTGKSYKVDVSLTKIYTPEEAQNYMKNYNNTGYQEGLSVGVLEYTLTGNEIDEGIEINPVTSVTFYPKSIYNNFRFNDNAYTIGFTGNATENLTYGKTVKVTGFYNFPSDQPVSVICIGDYDADQKGCFKVE